MTPEEVLRRALKLELDAIETYRKLKNGADPETAELLDFLISQEEEHVRLLSDRLKALRLLK